MMLQQSFPYNNNNNKFSPEQRKAIIEHLLITKNSLPHKVYPHVPCKFYRQGSCQAGDSCSFSHDLNKRPNVCKYFKRGECKFGDKCCNLHIARDDTLRNIPRINTNFDYPDVVLKLENTGITGDNIENMRDNTVGEGFDDQDESDDELTDSFFLPSDLSNLLTTEQHQKQHDYHNRSFSSVSSSSHSTTPLLNTPTTSTGANSTVSPSAGFVLTPIVKHCSNGITQDPYFLLNSNNFNANTYHHNIDNNNNNTTLMKQQHKNTLDENDNSTRAIFNSTNYNYYDCNQYDHKYSNDSYHYSYQQNSR
ncbi:uncharacterized protein SCODWIG_02594 [Saccharomycodes ludwigii]|uniref:C3H1-type domain-containing protein n=1 Tax=Saccharomycodes ludwigii TaxID=36035 RepID=A0A376B817_9ASCO|nr:hypothetical protein SCDLUD_001982 [Saccharomycodes ludwigii]KAH3902168.1 hypothetical protein SCDLUD_001982 [Saccharomycodes ludwigii]SSD60833.1 uncharacterized protein SCODWIG_02594 [Saccharomycodes ludwigii]